MLTHAKLAFLLPTHNNQTIAFKMKNQVATFPEASNSVVLSLAAYFGWMFPELPHPQHETVYKKVDESFPSEYLSKHPLFEPWVMTFLELILNKDAIRQGDTLYLLLRVREEYEDLLKKYEEHLESEIFNEKPSVKDLWKVNSDFKNKKIGYINVSRSQMNDQPLQPKINVFSILLGTIFNNEEWKNFNILKKEIPSAEILAQCDTLIIPGSTNSIMDNIEEVQLFTAEMMKALQQNKEIKVLGICYGHQLIGREFKSRLEKKPRFGGLQKIQFQKKVIEKFHFLKDLPVGENLFSEHHEDFVETIPENFYHLGTSNSCKVEALVSHSGKVLSFQFHPEYLTGYIKSFVLRTNAYMKSQVIKHQFETNEKRLKLLEDSSQAVRRCIMNFIES